VEASELKHKSIDAHRLWVAAGRHLHRAPLFSLFLPSLLFPLLRSRPPENLRDLKSAVRSPNGVWGTALSPPS